MPHSKCLVSAHQIHIAGAQAFALCRCMSVTSALRRLYAVGFATRQLTGNDASPSSLGGLAAARAGCHDAALGALLHCSMRQLSLVIGRDSAEAAQQGRKGSAQSAERQAAILKQQLLLPGIAPKGMALLGAAAAGPTDPLVPLSQQGDAGQVLSSKQRAKRRRGDVTARWDEAPYTYMRLGDPVAWRQHQHALHSLAIQCSGTADGGSAQQQQQVEVMLQDDEASDMAALMLQAPVPAECLQGPEVWWAWHQAMLELHKCDVCESGAGKDKQVGRWRLLVGK